MNNRALLSIVAHALAIPTPCAAALTAVVLVALGGRVFYRPRYRGPGSYGRLRLRNLPVMLLASIMPAVVQAQFNLVTNNGTITITRYTGTDGAVAIPDMTNGLPVTSLGTDPHGYGVFTLCNTVTNVIVPDTVRTIYGAFHSCSTLTGVTLGTNVNVIGDSAFAGCIGLASITIPDSVTSIGEAAFVYCSGLTWVTLGSNVASIGEIAFMDCTSLGAIAVPNNVTNIGKDAFQSCFGLTEVSLGTNVTSIGDLAFADCTSLKAITMPDSVTNLGIAAFEGCTNLTSITIPGGLTSIGPYQFENCWSLTNVTIPSTVTAIGIDAFDNDRSLTNITVPSAITNIDYAAFGGCRNPRRVYFEGNAPAVDPQAFLYSNTNATIIYYLPGTANWGPTFAGCPTALWLPVIQTSDGAFGFQANRFGFNVAWAGGQTFLVEAASDLSGSNWLALQTNILTSGLVYFSDPNWTNYPARLYRVRTP